MIQENYKIIGFIKILCALGAAEADAAILVINATRGEFETGFNQGGQTREHAILLRSLGKFLLRCAVNLYKTVL